MNSALCRGLIVVGGAIGLAIFGAPVIAGEDGTILVVGTVFEAERDEGGNIIAIDLESQAGTYAIDLSGEGAELLSHVGEIVEVEGVVFEDDDGWIFLQVLSFTVIPDSA